MFTRKGVSDIPFTSEARPMEGNPHGVYLRSFGLRSGYGVGSGPAQRHHGHLLPQPRRLLLRVCNSLEPARGKGAVRHFRTLRPVWLR